MEMIYADRDDVLAQLKLDLENPDHAAQIARVERLENGLSAAFDEKVGTSFGLPPEPETRTVYGDGGHLLKLEPRARSIESVAIGGAWDGTSWADETVLELGDWLNVEQVDRGVPMVIAIEAVDGVWVGPVRITATWDDQPIDEVPDDVREALTFITVDEYRMRNASPAGEIGPDGLVIPVRNPWRYELVKAAIRRHRVRRVRAGV